MGVPQIIWIVMMAMGLGISLTKHGQCRNEKYNFFYTALSCAIETCILYAGGFFG